MLRGLAALIVLITHFSDITGWLDTRLGGRAGQYGVMLFFMLSGFLMSYLYFDKKLTTKNIKHYALARFGRVVPLYLIVVCFSYFPQYFGYSGLYDISETNELFSHLLFIDGESVLWTIAPEIHFYIIFIGFWYLANWRRGYIYVIIFATLILLFLSNFPRPSGNVGHLSYDLHLFRSLPYFLVGIIFGMHYRTFKVPDYLSSNWFIICLILIPLMYPELTPVKSSARYKMWLNYEVLLVMATVFFSILFLVPEKTSLLSNKVGDFLGKISYSLYLLHMPILIQLNKLEMQVELKLIVFILTSVIIAYLSFHYIEKPLARLVRGAKRT